MKLQTEHGHKPRVTRRHLDEKIQRRLLDHLEPDPRTGERYACVKWNGQLCLECFALVQDERLRELETAARAVVTEAIEGGISAPTDYWSLLTALEK